MKRIIIILLTGLSCLYSVSQAATHSNYWKTNAIQVGYFQHSFLSPNLATPPSPLFWKASFIIDNGAFLWYRRMLTHSAVHFALYGGADIARLSYKHEIEMAYALFLDMHFYAWRRPGLNVFLDYSIAGPTILSSKKFGKTRFSNSFVFQDMLGVGISFNPKIPLAVGFDSVHYSNGGIFPVNGGIQIPFTLWCAYQF